MMTTKMTRQMVDRYEDYKDDMTDGIGIQVREDYNDDTTDGRLECEDHKDTSSSTGGRQVGTVGTRNKTNNLSSIPHQMWKPTFASMSLRLV